MRKVLRNHDEVAHVWAQQEQAEGRAGNMRFDGATIYSYGSHFPIARFVTNDAGERAVLFTTRGYSVSASQHISIVRGALRGLNVRIIECAYVESSSWGSVRDLTANNHHDNLKQYRLEIADALTKASRARQNKEWRLRDASARIAQMTRYVEFFALPDVVIPAVPADLSQLKAEADAAARQIAAERRAREEAIAAEQKAKLDAWLAGESVYYRDNYEWQQTQLRINGDEVQTTRGASFPVSHAKLGLRLVERVIAAGTPWHQNGEQCRLGHYRIDSIDANGTVHAGCHVVTYAAIQRIADQLKAA